MYNYFVETYYGATILLLLSLYSISYGYLAAVSSFTGIASLYAESHARKSRKVNTKLAEAEVSYEKQLEAAEGNADATAKVVGKLALIELGTTAVAAGALLPSLWKLVRD